MSSESVERKVEVDLSKLIEIDVQFKPLQLTLQDVLQRLSALEEKNAAKDAEIDKLQSELDALRGNKRGKRLPSGSLHAEEAAEGEENVANDESDDGELHAGEGGIDDLWDEIRRIKKLLGKLKESDERHTIDELYAARKIRQSIISSPPASRQGSAQAGAAASAATTTTATNIIAGEQRRRPSRRDSTKAFSQEYKAAEEEQGEVDENGQPVYHEVPIGDIILSKAREDLPLDDFDQRILLPTSLSHNDGEDEQPLSLSQQQQQEQEQERRLRLQQLYNERVGSAFKHGANEDTADALHENEQDSTRYDSAHAPQRGRVDRSASSITLRTHAALSPAQADSRSVFDSLLRDGQDIAYLNRVVAEMLGEMKSLHADVDFLRARNEPSTLMQTLTELQGDEDGSGDAKSLKVTPELLNGLLQSMQKLENEIYDVNSNSNKRDEKLGNDVAGLKLALKNTNAALALNEKELTKLQSLTGSDGTTGAGGNGVVYTRNELDNKLANLQNRLAEAERQTQMCQSKLTGLDSLVSGSNNDNTNNNGGVNRVEFGLLKGAVNGLEEQLTAIQPMLQSSYNNANKAAEQVDRLQNELAAIKQSLHTLEKDINKLDQRLGNVEQDGLTQKARNAEIDLTSPAHLSGRNDHVNHEDIQSRLNDLTKQLVHVQRELAHLEEDKADHPLVQRMQEELKNLKRLMELHAERAAALAAEGGKSREAAQNEREALQGLQQELMSQIENYQRDRESGQEEMRGLRELIDALDHRKADGTLVANKAERDYVENALERLMREVEQVLNATNAGLIDTLDKSLNILRDMLDGKANKKDIAALQQMMSEEAAMQNAADALTGFKGFRCLGCNRPVDSLRPRPLPAKLNAFVNRTPQNYPNDGVTRAIQQSNDVRGGAADNTLANSNNKNYRSNYNNSNNSTNNNNNNKKLANLYNDSANESHNAVNDAIENSSPQEYNHNNNNMEEHQLINSQSHRQERLSHTSTANSKANGKYDVLASSGNNSAHAPLPPIEQQL